MLDNYLNKLSHLHSLVMQQWCVCIMPGGVFPLERIRCFFSTSFCNVCFRECQYLHSVTFKLYNTLNMVRHDCEPVTFNRISCLRQHRHFNRQWNEHSATSGSLFGSASQDVAICGHNASSTTVRVSSVSLRTVTPIHGRRTRVVLLIPHSSCSSTTLLLLLSRVRLCLQAPRVPGWDPDWVGMCGMQIRVRGGRECHKVNEEIEQSGTWLAWPSAHRDPGSIFRRAEGLCSFVINAHCPWVDKPTNSSSDLSLCTDMDGWVLCVLSHFVSLFWSTHSCGKWHLRATHCLKHEKCFLNA